MAFVADVADGGADPGPLVSFLGGEHLGLRELAAGPFGEAGPVDDAAVEGDAVGIGDFELVGVVEVVAARE